MKRVWEEHFLEKRVITPFHERASRQERSRRVAMIDSVSAALIAATVAGASGGLTDVSKTAIVDAILLSKSRSRSDLGRTMLW